MSVDGDLHRQNSLVYSRFGSLFVNAEIDSEVGRESGTFSVCEHLDEPQHGSTQSRVWLQGLIAARAERTAGDEGLDRTSDNDGERGDSLESVDVTLQLPRRSIGDG